MDRIVKLVAYSNDNVFQEETYEESGEKIDFTECRVTTETLENGIVVETYYLKE